MDVPIHSTPHDTSRCTLAISQSNYIPWKGYFDLIAAVDRFILFDDMQYTRRDWRNRNRIKTPQGLQWLTIPVQVKGRFTQKICDTHIQSSDWAVHHWQRLRHAYHRAPFFEQYRPRFESLYLGLEETSLSFINYRFICEICDILGITTPLSWSMDHPQREGKTERLVGLCQAFGATTYLSGPTARNYLDASQFLAAEIDLDFIDYTGYPDYPQQRGTGPFEPAVTVLDLIFNVGPDAAHYMKHVAMDTP